MWEIVYILKRLELCPALPGRGVASTTKTRLHITCLDNELCKKNLQDKVMAMGVNGRASYWVAVNELKINYHSMDI